MGDAAKPETGRRRGPGRAVSVTLAALGLVAAAVGVAGPEVGVGSASAASKREAGAGRKQMPIPVQVVIPAIGVNARVVPLGLNPDRTMQVPRNLADTGWFRPGPEPGEQGAAVIVGHLASRSGPGVFARLSKLRPGAVITVRLRGGSTVRFVARSMINVSKSRFPTSRVYARTARPTLRLITCAGKLNPATGHHPDNYIVFATLAGTR